MTIDIPQVLGSMFQIAGFLTAILFSVYCFCIVSSNEFIVKIRHTKTFASSKRYIQITFSLGFFLTITSLLAQSASYDKDIQSVIFYMLAALTVYWLWRFLRCFKIFDTLSSIPAK